MHRDTRAAYDTEMASALTALKRGDCRQSFFHLGRAHILRQRSTFRHVYAHWLMLSAGPKQRDYREALGQILSGQR
ncbi:MAG: hypothetical protein DMF82_11660 [Acidobacteria bacterium]|nr:MAG: hypothetical protein DMF82_11660 [Acidobacteriota bacterium]